MSRSIEFFGPWLGFRLDAVGFAVVVVALVYIALRIIRRRHHGAAIPRIAVTALGVIALFGVAGAELAGSRNRAASAGAMTSLAPLYARELRQLDHARIGLAVSPDDPTQVAVQNAVREWLRLNPSLADLFTFRRQADGNVTVMIDGTGQGRLQLGEPTSYNRALAGQTFFDPQVHVDERGAWVRSFAPIRDRTGRIEAGLALGYHAGPYLGAIAAARGLVLGTTLALILAVLTFAGLVAVMRARMHAQAAIERELQGAKTAADEASRAKSDFLAVMSHEIRTPLNAVMGFANLLSESKLDEAQRGYVATITSEGLRLGSLVNDLLDLSKIEEGRLVLERLPFAPAETAHEVLRLLSGRALEKHLDLRFEAQLAGPLMVAGDPLRFRQVLINLVDNAIKFTPRGSVTVLLRWLPPGSGENHGKLIVRVRDTGIGIAAEKLGALFQKFVQADTSMTRRYGGSGLGLAICQRLVGLMGGKITVESTAGHGSEFAFTIPLAPVVPPVDAGHETPEPEAAPARPPRILVVDDMETNRFLLEVFLRRNGFEPDLAAGGEEAIRKAAASRYDAILMDLQMPDLDGFTAAQRIREGEKPGHRALIIALTASIAKGTREKCLAAGMDEHLTKPLDLKKFKGLLNTLLVLHQPAAGATNPGPSGPA